MAIGGSGGGSECLKCVVLENTLYFSGQMREMSQCMSMFAKVLPAKMLPRFGWKGFRVWNITGAEYQNRISTSSCNGLLPIEILFAKNGRIIFRLTDKATVRGDDIYANLCGLSLFCLCSLMDTIL